MRSLQVASVFSCKRKMKEGVWLEFSRCRCSPRRRGERRHWGAMGSRGQWSTGRRFPYGASGAVRRHAPRARAKSRSSTGGVRTTEGIRRAAGNRGPLGSAPLPRAALPTRRGGTRGGAEDELRRGDMYLPGPTRPLEFSYMYVLCKNLYTRCYYYYYFFFYALTLQLI